MPSAKPLPTIAEHITAFTGAVRGEKDNRADTRRGSMYDQIGGSNAILMSRQAQRDRDSFRAIFFDTADGKDLTDYAANVYKKTRITDSYGTGTCVFSRTSASAGAGTIWRGTRVRITGALSDSKTYVVTENTTVGASALSVTVPIRASKYGSNHAVQNAAAIVDDPLWDNSFSVVSLNCGEGTTFEQASVFRARVRREISEARKGGRKAIIKACQDAGASNVVVFESFWGLEANNYDDDNGLNVIYVGDQGFSGSADLAKACHLAIERARVLGASMFVGGMTVERQAVDATVTLVESPSLVNLSSVRRFIVDSLVNYYDENFFAPKVDGLRAACLTDDLVQDADFTTPSVDVTLTAGAWPSTLTRYVLFPDDVKLTFLGP